MLHPALPRTFLPGLLLLSLTALLPACDAGVGEDALPLTLVFDDRVETPPLDSVRVRLLTYDERAPADRRSLADVTLRDVEARTFTTDVPFDGRDLGAFDYTLGVETFFGGPKPFRKSFQAWVLRDGAPEPVAFRVTRAVEVAAGGRFTAAQSYRHDQFASDEACEVFNAVDGFMNCFQWVTFSPDGSAEFVWTDLANAGSYHIDGDTLTARITTRWDGPDRVRFVLADDAQALRLLGSDRRWINVPLAP